MTKQISIILFLGCLFTIGCQKESNTVSETVTSNQFFDLKGYFEEIIESYTEENVLVNKRVGFGIKTEKIDSLAIDWTKELQSFVQSDINKVAWVDKFKADTIEAVDGFTVFYQRLDASIPINSIEIDFSSDNNVKEIDLTSSRKSLLFKSEQVRNFKPGVSYSLDGWQRTLFLAKTEFEVNGRILLKEK